jgi:hypothetical protein
MKTLSGTIVTANGDLDIVVERVDRGKAGRVWLFLQKKTLNAIPSVFQELSNATTRGESSPRIPGQYSRASFPLFEWLALLLGMPFLYLFNGSGQPHSQRTGQRPASQGVTQYQC